MNEPSREPAAQHLATRFTREVDRERGIISQSNARAAGVAQFISAVLSGIGVVAAIILTRSSIHFTIMSAVLAVTGIICTLVMVGSMVMVMWPQMLHKLPRDASLEAYTERLAAEANEAVLAQSVPLAAELEEGYNLQKIRNIKEYATRVGLASTLAFTLLAIAFFISLQ